MLPRPVTKNRENQSTRGWECVLTPPAGYHAVQKAEKVDEPLRHDSFALLAPKNRNDRNQEFEKKSVKEKPRILFSKIFDCGARGHGTRDNPKKTGSYTHFLNSFNVTASNAWPNTQAHAGRCSFSLRFRLVSNPNNPPVTGLEHRTIGKRTPEWGYRCRHPPPRGGRSES